MATARNWSLARPLGRADWFMEVDWARLGGKVYHCGLSRPPQAANDPQHDRLCLRRNRRRRRHAELRVAYGQSPLPGTLAASAGRAAQPGIPVARAHRGAALAW